MATLESQIDELYQKPLDEFTGARNALAKTLSGADAQRVRKLPKPTVVPWAVNQLYWRERGIFERLRKSGERLRAAQIAALKGRAADLRSIADAHRNAVADASQHTLRLAGKADADELTRTLEALSLLPELPENPGRLTSPLQPAGFEALAGVVPAATAALSRGQQPAAQSKASAEGGALKATAATSAAQKQAAAAARRVAEAEARRAEADVKKAEAAVEGAAAAESKARQQWERAKRDLADAQHALDRARVTRSRFRSS